MGAAKTFEKEKEAGIRAERRRRKSGKRSWLKEVVTRRISLRRRKRLKNSQQKSGSWCYQARSSRWSCVWTRWERTPKLTRLGSHSSQTYAQLVVTASRGQNSTRWTHKRSRPSALTCGRRLSTRLKA